MSTPKRILREFGTSDSQMLQFARLVHNYMETDLAQIGSSPTDLNVSHIVDAPGSPDGEFSVIKVS